MKTVSKQLTIALLAGTMLMLLSCGHEKGRDDENMVFVTKEEFLQYINENDVGVKESDFEGVDIDDYIKESLFTADSLRRFSPKGMLDSYKREQDLKRQNAIMAQEILCVDSTDEEFDAFLQAFFEALAIQPTFLNTKNGASHYLITRNDERYYLYIGQTKNLQESTLDNKGYEGRLRILFPEGEMSVALPFCYDKNTQFFLAAMMGTLEDVEYFERISEIFVQTTR